MASAGAAFLLLVAHPNAPADTWPAAEPILVEGRYLQNFLGTTVNTLALYRVDAGQARPVPFQIDRRTCAEAGAEEGCRYVVGDAAGPPRAGTDEAPLGPEDEMVFLAGDAGECSGPGGHTGFAPSPPISKSGVEIRVENPETGEARCVYLDRRDVRGPPEIFRPEVGYDPSRDTVTAASYAVAHDSQSPCFWKAISLKRGEEWIPLFEAEAVVSEVSHAGSLVVYEIGRGDMRSRLVGYRAGPVRVIRVTRNRTRIGPFLWKEALETAVFYRDHFHTTFHTGTYLHRRFLTRERLRLSARLAPGLAGWRRENRAGKVLGLVDGRTSPEESAAEPDGNPELVFTGEAGTILYRLSWDVCGKAGRSLVGQAFLDEERGPGASAGICVPNLQDSAGPRHRFVKSLYFVPTDPDGGPAEAQIPGPRSLVVSVGGSELQGPAAPACRAETGRTAERPGRPGREDAALLEPCLRPAPGKEPERRWGIVPVVSSGPDKGLGAGVKFRHLGLLRPDHPLEARFLYTIYQYRIAEFWYLADRLPFRKSSLRFTCNYSNKTRARFYGIGNDTAESDAAGFAWQDLDLALVLDHPLPFGMGLLAGWAARWGSVGRGEDSDLPGLEDLHPDLFGIEGGWSNGPVLGLYRTTLEPEHNPISGGRQSFKATLAERSLGTYTFQRYRLEAVQVVPLPAYAHRLVLRGQAQILRGDPPFTLLSWVGGDDTARGHFEGRYRDRDRILLDVEYRCNLYKFFDGVLFLDSGSVAGDLFRSSPLQGLHVTGGFGMRFHLYPEIVVRFDVGFSPEMTGAYLNFGHTF
jgi:hypothetical protein